MVIASVSVYTERSAGVAGRTSGPVPARRDLISAADDAPARAFRAPSCSQPREKGVTARRVIVS